MANVLPTNEISTLIGISHLKDREKNRPKVIEKVGIRIKDIDICIGDSYEQAKINFKKMFGKKAYKADKTKEASLMVYYNDKTHAVIKFHRGKVHEICTEPNVFYAVVRYVDDKQIIKKIKDIVAEYDECKKNDFSEFIIMGVSDMGITSKVDYDGEVLTIKKWL